MRHPSFAARPSRPPTRPALGHGVGLRTAHFARFLAERPEVDWVEAVSENFMAPGGRPIAVLEQVRRDLPVVLHGVSLAIGSVDPLPERYLADLSRLVRRIEPALVSDHLCWGTHRGQYLHDLLPLPYTEEALAHVAGRVHAVQERLGRPLLLENPSAYLAYRDSTMTEWEFLAALVRRTGCGLLLDVNNVHVSGHNLGFDPLHYLAGVPLDAVGYLHLAGHSDHGRYLLDTHDHAVPAAVWALHRELVRRRGPVPTLVEWDEAIPPLEVVVAERDRAAALEAEELAAARRAS
ncbi:MAG: DUF692 domain-containing protein [Anaeromyxobacter sp.]|nr:DUF692 domain-containing protein [Anaeromyxobacter sp.]MBL0275196.1 DUF692 domain-containing protein [Anaeromyxobacter sp.]